jgi:L-ribulose-5-phosphate 4-epimerase
MGIRKGLREEVLEANLALVRHGLVTLTWGNASGIDRASGLVAIKPSGVPYEVMGADDIVVVDLEGRVVEGTCRPSTDVATHVLLYRDFPEIGGVVHTHSTWATSWAQAGRAIPILGTTHADLCPGAVPIARRLTDDEVRGAYEENTGVVLREAIGDRGIEEVPCALVPGHGPFTWGKDAAQAVERAVTLEQVARVAVLTLVIDPEAAPLPEVVVERHYTRKHGPGAYYGQPA